MPNSKTPLFKNWYTVYITAPFLHQVLYQIFEPPLEFGKKNPLHATKNKRKFWATQLSQQQKKIKKQNIHSRWPFENLKKEKNTELDND